MNLLLDIGNSTIFGAVAEEHGDRLEFKVQFRKTSKVGMSSDELGLFLRGVLRENGIDPQLVKEIALCSVVPDLNHSISNCCRKYFDRIPFILQAGVRTGLKIKYRNPLEVGSDRIANAIGAMQLFPNQDLMIVDFGTATTISVVSAQQEFLGGVIAPGVRLSMEALESGTAKIPAVEIAKPLQVVGRSTVENVQAGLFIGQVALVNEVRVRVAEELLDGVVPKTIGTGGFASLFAASGIFDLEVPELVLQGLYCALKLNRSNEQR